MPAYLLVILFVASILPVHAFSLDKSFSWSFLSKAPDHLNPSMIYQLAMFFREVTK